MIKANWQHYKNWCEVVRDDSGNFLKIEEIGIEQQLDWENALNLLAYGNNFC